MLRKAQWFVAAALVVSTAGCVESMDASYAAPSYGYDNGYYSSGYYSAPQAYYSPPVVYSQTRYVPVPTPVPVPVPVRQASHGNDRRWNGHNDQPRHVDRQPTPAPAPSHPQPLHNGGSTSGGRNDGNHHDGNHRDANRDRNGDGRPDRRS